ncbi:MAG: RNA pseudouridine synthase [Lachnospiraceae bacterium]|nr:RNA pseudouridine synthase [Lachnospiraceae bacterium]
MRILFEDEKIIVVLKSPGEPSQADKTGDADIASMLKEKCGCDIFVVHRLDRPVGGVMVYAKDSVTAASFTASLKHMSMNKRYLAVVNGKPAKEKSELINYIISDTRKNISKIVTGPKVKGAKEARLYYEVLAYDKDEDLSLLDIKLFTGRHHQIRVQLSSMGNPIWGDIKYNKAFLRKRTMPALWSYSLEINHPEKGILTFKEYPIDKPFDIFEKNLKTY